ncbi:MAG: class I SAM-dependent methyltransferase [Planctomycetes bacterium]|nr:class I SAM-dependent methyltransferase [Planctomycetota bacterium]
MDHNASSATDLAPLFAAAKAQAAARPRPRSASLAERLARRAVLGRMRDLGHGHLLIAEDGIVHALGSGAPEAYVEINDPATWTAIAGGGTVGAGAAYMAGHWSCADLTALIRIFVRNRAALDGMERGVARFGMNLFRVLHALNRNTRTGSRRNIAAHYDLGNDFYRLWLDQTMMYSSALFLRDDMTLHEAQLAKLDRLCDLLELTSSDHLLEIGSGWGGLAIHAATRTGCRVTTTTISRQQYDLARQRVAQAGLGDRVTVLLEDYRDLTGTYDKLVSVEMIEAVGHQYYDTYFGALTRLLKPDGLAVIQAITITEQQYATAIREVDFIQRYIFPGSNIPSLGAITTAIARSGDLNLVGMDDLAPHYVRTLQCWREGFQAKRAAVCVQGFDERFIRMWEFYLAYCEGGFAERAIGVAHLRLARSGWRHGYQRRLDGNT